MSDNKPRISISLELSSIVDILEDAGCSVEDYKIIFDCNDDLINAIAGKTITEETWKNVPNIDTSEDDGPEGGGYGWMFDSYKLSPDIDIMSYYYHQADGDVVSPLFWIVVKNQGSEEEVEKLLENFIEENNTPTNND